ncbi:MAG: Rne/Rng family ribonuclease [Pseudomonadota bacterium]
MSTEIVVNSTGRETRVAILEGGVLAELHIDRGQGRGYVGNIYYGKVVRVLPGMQAAFVDIGLERAAFLYVGDIFPAFLDLAVEDEPLDPDLTVAEESPHATPREGQPPIQDLLREGQSIVVQVAKDPIGTKGARITTHITLPGRYLVYMPTVDHIGISRRIEKDRERRRLRAFVEKHRQKGAGFIVRTVCENQPTAELKQDMDYLVSTWERVQEAVKDAKAPSPLHEEHDLVLRVVRDVLDESVQRMVVDDQDTFDRVRGFMKDFLPRLRERVQLYRGVDPCFDVYGIETEIVRSLGRKVWLKSGGYLVIDQTEALTAIDVNSGKYVGTSNLEDTTLKINLDAVNEVVYQLRLRNIGGIIIIDFIDMEKEQNRDKVFRTLGDALKRDRARTNIIKISELGLVEMTRKRVQEDLIRFLSEPCLYCEGRGHTRSRTTVCFDILREVQREAKRSQNRENIMVNAHPAVADLLYGDELASLEGFEQKYGRRIVVRAVPHYHLERFEVYSR